VGAILAPSVAGAAIVVHNAKPLRVLEGDSTREIRVATFSDAPPCAGGYTVDIDWGDGQRSAGRVVKPVQIAPDECAYDAEGEHTYRVAGIYPVTATICRAAECVTTAIAGTATVLDAEVRGDADDIRAVTGQAFTGRVAEVNDRNRLSVAGDFTALVDWGDGTPPTPGQISGADGRLEVAGGHVYAAPGTYRTLVTVAHAGRSIVLDAGSAQVAGAALAPFTASSQTAPDAAATTSLRLLGSTRVSRRGLQRNGVRLRVRVGSFTGRQLSYRVRDARNGRTVFRGRVSVGRVTNGVATVRVRFSRRNLARLRRSRTYGLTLPRQGGLPTLQTRFRLVR
jgi:hypothetical protein